MEDITISTHILVVMIEYEKTLTTGFEKMWKIFYQ